MLAGCKGLTLLFHPSNIALHFGPLAAIRLQHFGSNLEGKISVPAAGHPYSSLVVLSQVKRSPTTPSSGSNIPC